MKYIAALMAMILFAIGSFGLAMAEEEITAKQLEKNFSLFGQAKFDLFAGQGKPAFTEFGLFLYAHYKFGDYGFGAGVDQWGGWDKLQSNHWTARPFMTINWRQFYGIAGYSADSKHGDGHVFTGIWFVDKWWKKLDVFLDARYYTSFRTVAPNFVDVFISFRYGIGENYKVGPDAEYTGWLGKDRGHNWFMGGLAAEQKFGRLWLGLRPGVSWDVTPEKGSVPTFWLRTYVNF